MVIGDNFIDKIFDSGTVSLIMFRNYTWRAEGSKALMELINLLKVENEKNPNDNQNLFNRIIASGNQGRNTLNTLIRSETELDTPRFFLLFSSTVEEVAIRIVLNFYTRIHRHLYLEGQGLEQEFWDKIKFDSIDAVDGETVLTFAITHKMRNLVDCLFSYGEEWETTIPKKYLETPNRKGQYPLILAHQNGCEDFVHKMIKKYEDQNNYDWIKLLDENLRNLPMMWLVSDNIMDVEKFLRTALERPHDENHKMGPLETVLSQQDRDGNTLLMLACKKCEFDLVELLAQAYLSAPICYQIESFRNHDNKNANDLLQVCENGKNGEQGKYRLYHLTSDQKDANEKVLKKWPANFSEFTLEEIEMLVALLSEPGDQGASSLPLAASLPDIRFETDSLPVVNELYLPSPAASASPAAPATPPRSATATTLATPAGLLHQNPRFRSNDPTTPISELNDSRPPLDIHDRPSNDKEYERANIVVENQEQQRLNFDTNIMRHSTNELHDNDDSRKRPRIEVGDTDVPGFKTTVIQNKSKIKVPKQGVATKTITIESRNRSIEQQVASRYMDKLCSGTGLILQEKNYPRRKCNFEKDCCPEYELPGKGRIDILTPSKVIEVKALKHWKHALGQVLAYHIEVEAQNKRNRERELYLFFYIGDGYTEELAEGHIEKCKHICAELEKQTQNENGKNGLLVSPLFERITLEEDDDEPADEQDHD